MQYHKVLTVKSLFVPQGKPKLFSIPQFRSISIGKGKILRQNRNECITCMNVF